MESIFFLGLNLAAWITLITVLAMFLSLIFTRLPDLANLFIVNLVYPI